MKEINCCFYCNASCYDKDEYPPKFVPGCYNDSCICHKNTDWGENGVECENECGYQEPYGFVPEADCPVHDAVNTVVAGVDFTESLDKLNNLFSGKKLNK